MAELSAERDGRLGEPSDPLRPLEGRRSAEILVRELDALVVAEGDRLFQGPGEIVVRPGAEIGGQRAGARHGVEPFAGLEPRDLEREILARAVELADPQGLAGKRERGISSYGGSLSGVCGPARGVNAEPSRPLAARHDLALRAPALEAEDGVHLQQPPARGRAAVPGLLVRHAHDLEQAERPRPFGQQPSRVQRDRDAALHVGHARPVAALALPPERPCGRSAQGEDGVVMAEQRDARGARPAQRGVEREPAGRLHELGIEPVALGLQREDAGQPVEGLEVAARRVDVDPRGEVGEQEVELGAGSLVNARSLGRGDRRRGPTTPSGRTMPGARRRPDRPSARRAPRSRPCRRR